MMPRRSPAELIRKGMLRHRKRLTYEGLIEANRSLDPLSGVDSESTLEFLSDLVSNERDRYRRAAYCIFYIGHYRPFSKCNEDTALRLASEMLGYRNRLPSGKDFRDRFMAVCGGDYPVEDIEDWLRRCSS